MPSHYGHKGMEDIYSEDTDRYHDFDEAVKAAEHLEGEEKVDALSDAAKKRELGNNMLKEISGTAAGTGVEIGAGYATDLVTVGLLNPATIAATGGLSVAGYAGLNFASGVASNYAAQKLRGEEKISYGELLTSGAVDLIPFFGTKLKGAKGITNIALQSGAKSVLQRQGEVAIDEQRPLTFAELVQSGAFGGAFGTVFKGGGEVISTVKKADLGKRLLEQVNPGGTILATSGTGLDRWDLATSRSNKYGNMRYWTNLSGANQKLFKQAGLTDDDAIFLLSNWDTPVPRNIAAAIEDPYFSEGTFNFMKGELLPELLKGLEGVEGPKKIEIDHVAQLRAILQFYNNRKVKQFPKIRAILQEEGIFGGHNPKNLKGLPEDIHTIKSRFWTKHVGQDGSKFFAGRKLRTYKEVRAAAKEMNKLMERSNKIVESVSAQYKFLNKKDITSEELIQILEKFDLNHGDYNLKEINNILRDVVPEIDAVLAVQEVAKTVPKINILKLAQEWQKVDPIKFEALMFKIQGATTKQVKSRYPGLSAKQLNIFDQMTPQQYQMLQNRYKLGGKAGPFSKPIDPTN